MAGVSKNIERCDRCRLHKNICICNEMPFYDLLTHILLVIHRREYKKVSSTGPLALKCLKNSSIMVHGNSDSIVDLNTVNSKERRLFFLYPREDAQILTTQLVSGDERPITLIVPDGNWNQATRMARRLPGIENATFVTLPEDQVTRWGLRKETKEGGLSTFEAISRALGIIESQEVELKMNRLFDLMVARVKNLRGVS
jgi:tRNA-uridine aminocarboxypropyltransferase